jgi:drug/metabolite transporter (DMT)-like permease
MSEKPSSAPYLAFVTVCLIWGSTFLFIGLSNEVMPPMWSLSLRLLLAGIFLTVAMALLKIPFPKGAALKTVIAYGICEFAGNLGFLYWGETKIPSGLAAVIYGTSPILTIMMESAFGMEKLDLRKLIAGIAALAGIAIIFWREVATGLSPIGILSVFLAATIGTLGVILLKRGPKQSPIAANAIGFFVALPIILTWSFVAGEPHSLPSTPRQWIPLLYLVMAGSLGAFVLFAWLLGRWKVSSASFVAVIVPIIAVILGVLVHGEKIAPESFIGAAVVIVATAWVLRTESTKGTA